jgi:phosphoserine phosphatase
MATDVEELEKKRGEANTKADAYRAKRDTLNSEVRALMDRRATLIRDMRDKSDAAWAKRNERDRLNDAVREAKKNREEWNQKVSHLTEQLHERRKTHDVKKGNVSLWRLLKDLEFKHMTSSLSKEAEERLIGEMQRIQREIKSQEEKFRKDPEVLVLTKELDEAKVLAEKHHQEVEQSAASAQKNHEEMGHLYEEVDKLRRELDELQGKITTVKTASDEEHQHHIAAIEEVRDIEKLLFAAKRKAAGEAGTEEAPKEDDLFARIKKGGKISTEDLLALQKG